MGKKKMKKVNSICGDDDDAFCRRRCRQFAASGFVFEDWDLGLFRKGRKSWMIQTMP